MADTPPSRTARRKAQTRARLIAAARRQIADAGVHGLSIAATTEDADVALGTFYNHFDSKDELVEECLAGDWDRHRTSLEKELAEAGGPAEQVAAIVHVCLMAASVDPLGGRCTAQFWSADRWPPRELVDHARVAVEAGATDGTFRVDDVDRASGALLDSVGALIRRWTSQDAPAPTESMLSQAVRVGLGLLGASRECQDAALSWARNRAIDLTLAR